MDHFSKRKGSRDKTCACSPSGDHVCDLREEAGHHNDRYRLEQSIDGKNWLRSGVPKRCTPALLYGDESAKLRTWSSLRSLPHTLPESCVSRVTAYIFVCAW